MAVYNKVMRFALGDAGATAAIGVNITQARYNAMIDHGDGDLATGFASPTDQAPVPMSSTTVGSICHDWSGNLYITDSARHAIYKIAEDNALTIVAGLPGTPGNLSDVTIKDASNLNRAAFAGPEGICCDKSGNLYVADTGNNCIKMIANGRISLIAGAAAGFVDADRAAMAAAGTNAATVARFRTPRDLAIDKSGNLYIADTENHAIRKINKGGEVLTIAGNGHAGDAHNVAANKYTASFDTPVGVTVDPSGNVYVLDGVNNYIKKITPNGWIYRFSGSGVSGRSLGTLDLTDPDHPYTYSDNCTYEYLSGIDADESGNIYVIDMGLAQTNSRLIKIDASGRPGVVVDFSGVTDDWFIVDVTCTPGQKLYVTVSNEMWTEASTSSASSSSSSYVENWSSSSD